MRYYSFHQAMLDRFGCKVYKLSLNAGLGCPNRDGTVGSRGCSFCSALGSGDFAPPVGFTSAFHSTVGETGATARVRASRRSLNMETYLANATERVSRITVIFTCPG